MSRALLEQLEEQLEPQSQSGAEAPLAFLALQEVELDAAELAAALRRSVLLLASGGDPRRELDLQNRAVGALAADLADAQARASLLAALGRLRAAAAGLPSVSAALEALLADEELAWRWGALALLADELAGD